MRACLFDMDGLLINTEDIYTVCHNKILSTYSSGPLTWDIKSQLQGRPSFEAIQRLLAWFKLDNVSVEEYSTKLRALQEIEFTKAQPLPGVEQFLCDLKNSKGKHHQIHIALATSSPEANFKIKTAHLSELFSSFTTERTILGDNPKIPHGRGKPYPDIYLLALRAINETLSDGETPLKPNECLVFEDGVPGVVAGRRAGMRVIWVPHQDLVAEFKDRGSELLNDLYKSMDYSQDEELDMRNGWVIQMENLVNFPFDEFEIVKNI